jgi:phosphoribosyl 1,2-cyclic phosphodiesterase
MMDAGRDWGGLLGRIKPDALVITHAHPDHVDALRQGCPCPVYATSATWRLIGTWPIRDRRLLRAWTTCTIQGARIEAVPVAHSIRAPAVGYRITVGRETIFYAPDIAALPQPGRALAGVCLFVGDGAAITRPILRKRNGVLIGHASIAMQLGWCRDHHVGRAVFTHCGSEIVRANHRQASAQVRILGRERGVDAVLASDGDVIHLSGRVRRGPGRQRPSPTGSRQ